MPKIIEAVYEGGVIKPLSKLDVKDGKVTVIVIEKGEKYTKRKKFLSDIEPINLGRKITIKEIEKLREERYASLS